MNYSNIKALVVDDLDYIRSSLLSLLGDMGITNIQEAEDGEIALEKILNEYESGAPFQVILCDVHMPNCDGISLLERIRSDKRVANVPVLMVSSESDVSIIKKLILMGADSYLLKPFTSDNLEKKIHSVLKVDHVA
ncbi:response regulator [Halobacteriovorax sp.]|uniref:response regulator n=1 Tax=Halobacteriovorax sp. TaxID=2020862 RepID=UPI003AF2ECDE